MRDAFDGDHQRDSTKIGHLIRGLSINRERLPAVEYRIRGRIDLGAHLFGSGIVVPLLVDLVLNPFVIADRNATSVGEDVW